MRLTKAHLFALLAITVPIVAHLAWFWLLETRSWLGLEPWYREDVQVQVGAAVTFSFAVLTPLVLVPLALLVATPSSSWVKWARSIGLNILGLVYLLVGGLVLIETIFQRGLTPALILLACLPMAARIYYGIAKDANLGTTAGRFIKGTAVWLLVFAAFLAFIIGVAFGAKAIDVAAVTFLIRLLPFLPLVLLVSYPANLFLRWRARRRGKKQVLLCLGLYANLAQWKPMPQARAEEEWNKMYRIPRGGELTGAWLHSAAPLFRLECLDSEGSRYMLLGNVPVTPWPQWMAGLFLRSEHRGPSGGPTTARLRFFERTDCPWTPMPDDQMRTEPTNLSELTAEDAPTVGWTCPDCAAQRLDMLDVEGKDFLVYRNLPHEQELKWVAGIYFVFAKAPTLASDTLDSPRRPANTEAPVPSPATQP